MEEWTSLGQHKSISPSNEYSGFISFKIDWFDLLAVEGTSIHGIFQARVLEWGAIAFSQLNNNKCGQEGRGGSEEAVPGPSVFPSREAGVSGKFWGGHTLR